MTTFSSEEARRLRERLPELGPNAAASANPLLDSFLSHYGLNSLSVPWPVRHNLGIVDSGSYRLVCQTFDIPAEQQQGRIVIVHGYYDHVGLYRHIIAYCLSRGLSVLTFDLPGHGLSSGDPAGINSFDEYSQALVDCLMSNTGQEHRGPWHIMAQSTGASAVINCLLYPDRFPLGHTDKIIFLAPLIRPLNWTRGQLTFWLVRWLVKQVKRDKIIMEVLIQLI